MRAGYDAHSIQKHKPTPITISPLTCNSVYIQYNSTDHNSPIENRDTCIIIIYNFFLKLRNLQHALFPWGCTLHWFWLNTPTPSRNFAPSHLPSQLTFDSRPWYDTSGGGYHRRVSIWHRILHNLPSVFQIKVWEPPPKKDLPFLIFNKDQFQIVLTCLCI